MFHFDAASRVFAHLDFEPVFCSEGTIENSAALKCRDRLEKRRVPLGRLKQNPSLPRLRCGSRHPQSSLRDLFAMPPDPGVQTPGYFQNVPAGHRVFLLRKNLDAPLSILRVTKFLFFPAPWLNLPARKWL